MRFNCEIEVVYALALAAGGVPSKSSRTRASVCLAKKPIPKSKEVSTSAQSDRRRDELYLIVSTTKNVEGSKYKVKNNVTKVFSKFVEQGKATIKFRDPAHDLAISKADPAKLKELLNVLRLSPQEQTNVSVGHALPPKLQHIEKPKSKLVVKSRVDYPIKGFPESLETVQAVGLSLNRIDLRILQLRHIQNVDLSNNFIKAFPECIKDVKLVELKLSGNKISELPEAMCSGDLVNSLKVLDLARNELAYLPHSFPSFKSLVQLRLDCNNIQMLPRAFGKMSAMKFFSASNNKLVVLPPSFPSLNLESLDLFANPFSASGLVRTCKTLSLPTLQEIAGRYVKKNKIPYDPYTLPVMLCHYLDSAKRCLCGRACFDSYLHYIASLDLHKVSSTVIAVDKGGTTKVPIEAFLCSAKCLRLWKL